MARVDTMTSVLMAAALSAAVTLPVSAQGSAEDGLRRVLLIERDLDLLRGELLGLDELEATIRVDGAETTRPLSDLLGLVRLEASVPANGESPMVEFVDGRRIVGVFDPRLGETAEEGRVSWSSDYLGTLSIPLEEVAAMRLRRGAAIPRLAADAAGDRLLLSNGDAVEGFLASMGSEIVVEPMEGEPLTLEAIRVASVALLNPRAAAEGISLWTSSGSVVEAEAVRMEYPQVNFSSLRSGEVTIPLDELSAICFDERAFVPLARLTPAVSSPSDLPGAVESPAVAEPGAALGLSDVLFRGPVRAVYVLEGRTGIFRAEAEVPAESRLWADLSLVVRVDGREAARHELGNGQWRAEVSVEFARARMLEIAVEEAGRGPIEDVVVLRSPRLAFAGR